jgi:molybdenum cofactor cytidylyltransferase
MKKRDSGIPQVGLVILAAGAASRMGQPKQLLTYRGQPLIQHVVGVAQQSRCQSILVVLGAHAAQIQPLLADLCTCSDPAVCLVQNSDWSQGISSSIRLGLNSLLNQTNQLDAIGFLLCDQPLISADLINQLIDTYQTCQQPIVACEYADTLGVPALFDRQVFPELAALTGDRGARSVIQQFRSQVAAVPFPGGSIDLDTLADYARLIEED